MHKHNVVITILLLSGISASKASETQALSTLSGVDALVLRL